MIVFRNVFLGSTCKAVFHEESSDDLLIDNCLEESPDGKSDFQKNILENFVEEVFW